MSDKTEEPTPKRLRKAEQEGNLPVSAALVSASAFVMALTVLPAAIGSLTAWVGAALRQVMTAPSALDPAALLEGSAVAVLASSVPLLAASSAVAVLIGLLQTGVNLAPARLAPDLGRLSPIQGLAGLFGAARLSSLVRALFLSLAVVWLARGRLREHLPDLAASLLSPSKAAVVAAQVASRLARDVGALLLVAAAVDVGVTRRSHHEKLKMTRAEVKQESRESEGDPQLKAARERAHHELLAQASILAVKDATVVVVNPTHLATALRYREGEDDAPRVLARGDGALAAKIIEAAEAYGVPVVRDIPLARALHELEVGDEIPEALYEAVAEVLRSLWREAEEPERVNMGADPPPGARRG